MEILDRIVGELKDAFKYCKTRTKNKYYGDRFEEWVVKSSNISKNGFWDSHNSKAYWKLLEWRGDKYIDGYRPLSSSAPDLLMECISDKKRQVGEIIAVECKWRSTLHNFYLEKEDVCKYEGYVRNNKSKDSIKCLFYVFGFGWSDNNPKMVYVIPADKLYDYNKDTCAISFHAKGSAADIAAQFDDYKWEANYLMYWYK